MTTTNVPFTANHLCDLSSGLSFDCFNFSRLQQLICECSTFATRRTSQHNVNLTCYLAAIDFLSQAGFQICTINSSLKLRRLNSLGRSLSRNMWHFFFSPIQGVCSKWSGGGDSGVLQRHAGHSATVQVWEAAVCWDPDWTSWHANVPGVRSSTPAASVW